jgi:CheY-like chemotaxis protein
MDQAPIFIVDDEPMLLELASLILDPLKHPLRTFRDPEQAFQEFLNGRPRPWLLITDYQMHAMNGMDLIRLCRNVDSSVRILLVSGTVGEEVYANSAVKPDRFLAKPYTPAQMIEAVEKLMRK